MKSLRPGLFSCVCLLVGLGAGRAQDAPPTSAQPRINLAFDFGIGPLKEGYTRVAPTAMYADDPGYGYEPGAEVKTGDDGHTTTSKKPFMFSVKVPEGNYSVYITHGDSSVATTTTFKAESGRLMIERAKVQSMKDVYGGKEKLDPESHMSNMFSTNVRTAKLPKLPLNATGREEVSLDQFDAGNKRDWDGKLTIEVVSQHAAIRTIGITSAPEEPTVFLAGDSTVTDRDGGGDVSWGQMLPRFFHSGVAVANEAQSGETMKSFANALRLDKILSQMKKGDYLFIQFAHNDSKANWPQTYVEPETTYKAYLKVYIAEARLRGATPVLVTAMDRANRTTGALSHGHGMYIEAMREVAREEHVALIDLYAMSITFYEAAGVDAPKILADGTHSTAYGGYELAKCVVMGIKAAKLDLAGYIVTDFKDFDPAHPDSASQLDLGVLFSGGAGGRGAPPAATAPVPSAPPVTGPRDPGLGPL